MQAVPTPELGSGSAANGHDPRAASTLRLMGIGLICLALAREQTAYLPYRHCALLPDCRIRPSGAAAGVVLKCRSPLGQEYNAGWGELKAVKEARELSLGPGCRGCGGLVIQPPDLAHGVNGSLVAGDVG